MTEKIDEIMKAKRILLYGTGETGRLFELVLNKRNKTFETFDDILNNRTLKSLQEVSDYYPDYIIICSQTKKHTDTIKTIIDSLKLNCEVFIPSANFIGSLKMFSVIDEINFSIFESNDFLDAMRNGYLNFECKYLYSSGMKNWYSYNDIKIEKDDIVIDCGASCGAIHDSTPDFFAQATSNTIYAFEPEPRAYEFLKKEMEDNKNVVVLNKAVGDINGKMYFHVGKFSDSKIVDAPTENSIEVDVVKIDDMVSGRVDFIKMDIEGAELSALKGAEHTIKIYKPKLAICVYHKSDDVITIPNLIKELCPEYKIWLVNNEGHLWMGTKIFAKVY